MTRILLQTLKKKLEQKEKPKTNYYNETVYNKTLKH